MEQNCYKIEEGKYYTIVHFSAIAGWHIMENDLEYPGYTPFDQNRLNFPTTSDRSVYEAWLRYKNGDLGLPIAGTEEQIEDLDLDDEVIFWNGDYIPLPSIEGWTCEKDDMLGMISDLAPILIGDIKLPSRNDPDAIIAFDKWRAWQKKEKGIDYPPLN
jgi:hypothetical protein